MADSDRMKITVGHLRGWRCLLIHNADSHAAHGWQAWAVVALLPLEGRADQGEDTRFDGPPDGRTLSGGQKGRLGLTALSADSER
jgi:ABC-type transport system involved in cytochrome bd biosynthesis fused ATPase/permease subunit